MKSVFLLQLQRLRREPILVLSMMAMTFGFVFLLGGMGSGDRIEVPIYFDEAISQSGQEELLDRLNQSDTFVFQTTEEAAAEKQVALGEITYAIKAMPDNYRMLVAADDPNQLLVNQYVQQVYADELRLQKAEAAAGDTDFRKKVDSLLADAPITLTGLTAEGESDSAGYDQKNQFLFGMTLFFSIYTVILSLGKVAEEKRTGTWHRVILSPVRKFQIYIGHLSYAFMIGFSQILFIFLSFKYVFNYELGNHFEAIVLTVACYTFAIVALGMLMLGLVKSLEQLNALVPIVSVSMAMIGGAYWPIEAVSNNIILAVSKVLPMTYAMDSLKGIALHNQNIASLAEPLSIMVLFGVLCMGIGVNLMERTS
ncbi:ABC transporter permease [Sediminibacillus albus]|uniref:ABC-2 type transport system permease protein n=1 Tax=Sediminibacillus albus TaxID=407036 RepID=A0A1G8WL57_9BACI|nr:ABC transporter permease [Sediminibacillus albus]SDJ78911.1 ABC-2 type transport system permease protein [Sediminibacillus albus]